MCIDSSCIDVPHRGWVGHATEHPSSGPCLCRFLLWLRMGPRRAELKTAVLGERFYSTVHENHLLERSMEHFCLLMFQGLLRQC